jgi:glyoxylate/hydroxypyruvate reductase A
VLEALGFPVRGWRRDGTRCASVLAETDIVVNALPLTPQTEDLLDAEAFAAMPRGSYVINIARGGHVVEADLIAAVRSGHLAGAALDVQRHEPLPADDPLWDVPGITVTPHIAAQPDHATVAAQFVANLRCLRPASRCRTSSTVPAATDRRAAPPHFLSIDPGSGRP